MEGEECMVPEGSRNITEKEDLRTQGQIDTL